MRRNEITYVTEGELELCTAAGKISLQKGDAVFINSNVLHDARSSGYFGKIFQESMGCTPKEYRRRKESP